MTDFELHAQVETAPANDNEQFPGVWAYKNRLVVRTDAEMPPYCIKTGEPVQPDEWLEVELYGNKRPAEPMLLLDPFSQLVEHSLTRRTISISLGFSAEARMQRFYRMLPAIVFMGVGVAATFTSAAIDFGAGHPWRNYELISVIGGVGGIVLAVSACFFHRTARGIVSLAEVTDKYVVLYGADRRFLGRLPPWHPQ